MHQLSVDLLFLFWCNSSKDYLIFYETTYVANLLGNQQMMIEGKVLFSNLFDKDMAYRSERLLNLSVISSKHSVTHICDSLDCLLFERFKAEIFQFPESMATFRPSKPYSNLNSSNGAESETVKFLCSLQKNYSSISESFQVRKPIIFDQNGVTCLDLALIQFKAITAVAVEPIPYTLRLSQDLSLIGVNLKLTGVLYDSRLMSAA